MPTDSPLVLIIENDALVAMFYEELLRREGFRTMLAPATAEALRALQAEPPAAAIVDLRLQGGEDGREVAEALTQSDVPVIIASAYSHTLGAAFLDRVRPAAIVPKPPLPNELLGAIRGALKR